MSELKSGYYRVSVKALILNETKDKFLICEEKNGVWELPGGGLDWGKTPQEDLPREIGEEMGLSVTSVSENPSYFITDQNIDQTLWVANAVYETTVEHLNFTPSDECMSVKFVDYDDIKNMNVFPTVKKLAEIFDPSNHS
ncbi:MAG: NUDIX hydrolase [Candidatus Kaiserbacteria bacterium]|nr:NUDIX hydrolase [Candidatus Kaiserbacteria bacterium]MCB9816572.1 NUDIX hydrolase [Candidatus Nomurabacteria bacterium]